MNKEISVQYAYKKDGKGERHGDQAERVLAAQARKHNVQPTGQPLPASLFTPMTPITPTTMVDTDASRMMGGMPPSPAMFLSGRGGIPNGNYQSPAHPQQRPVPPSQPLPTPPSGLPARPPPSQAGYGGPQGFLPQGFNPPPPPGFKPLPSGTSPGLPSGFQPTPFLRSR